MLLIGPLKYTATLKVHKYDVTSKLRNYVNYELFRWTPIVSRINAFRNVFFVYNFGNLAYDTN